uniref:Methyltransferase n=1 Tax=Ananas comosus var. bracteatus TaxID=296719 RepID=A0A6V7NI79_ANACO|nr:unnamed protein product [Ananas comosus var. bracteatus]
MAFGKSTRMDGRRSSSYCSTTTIVVFVALCLVGVWMMTSSTVVPIEMSSSDRKDQVSGTDSSRKSVEKTQEESPVKGNEDGKAESEGKAEAFNDANGKTEGGEAVVEGGDSNTEGERQGQIEEKVDQSEDKDLGSKSKEVFPDGAQSELLNETTTQNGAWSTQAAESKNEKEVQSSSNNNQFTVGNFSRQPALFHFQMDISPIEWPKSRDKIWYSNVPHTKLAEYKGHQTGLKFLVST